MSLLAWFPLNNSLTNLGEATLTMTTAASGSVINQTGKTAPYCYYNNSYSSGGYVSNETITLGQNQSIFAWVKFTNLTSDSSLGGSIAGQHRYPTNVGMGLTIKYVSSTTGYLSVNTGNGSSRTYNTYCGSTLLQANTWYHLGYTYDGSTIRLYVNGNLDGSHAYSGMSTPKDYFMIGCWSFASSSGNGVYSGYKLYGYLNDVRAYNHTLSTKEIKNLARGLILHYDFENLYEEIDYIQTTGTQYINTGVIGQAIWVYDIEYTASNVNTRQLMGHGGSGGEYWGITNGKWGKATWSTSSIAVSGRSLYRVENYSGGGSVYVNGDYAYNNSYDSRSENSQAQIFAIGGSFCAYCKLYSCQVYNSSETEMLRDFVPAIRKTDGVAGLFDKVNGVFYTNAGSGNFTVPTSKTAIIQDCSGNSLHGIASNITISNSTCIGTQSAVFNGSSSHIVNEYLPLTTNMTFACWLKFSGTSGYHIIDCRAASGETGVQPMYGGTNYGLQCYSSAGGSYTWSAATCGFTTNTWYHIVVTYTSSNATLYINGVSKGTQSGNFGSNFGYRVVKIGSRVSNTNWFNGQIADVRIYATTLSAADVEELYKVRGMIDKAGNVYCDGTSSSNTFALTKKGVMQIQDYSTDATIAKISGKYTRLNFIDQINPAAGAASQHNRCTIDSVVYNYIEARVRVTGSGSSGGIMLAGKNGTWWKSWQGGGSSTVTMSPSSLTENTWTNVTWTCSSTFTGLWTSGWSDATNYWTPQNLKVAYIRTYNGNVMTGEFIPVMKKSNSTLGLFDILNGVFYPNTGTGSFAAGQAQGQLNTVGCNNFYKDGGCAIAEYPLTQKRLMGNISFTKNTGVSSYNLIYHDVNGQRIDISGTGNITVPAAINYPYSWTAYASSGYTMNTSSGSGINNGSVSISPTATATGSWYTVWTGSQALNVGSDPSDPSMAYGTTTISGLSAIKSSYPLQVKVTTTYGNSGWVSASNEPVKFSESRKSGSRTSSCESSVWAPEYASSTSVTITARFDDQSSGLLLFPSITATEIQAYH